MWYYILNNKPTGPIEESQIAKFVKDGVITQKTKVWRKGMQGWVPAEDTDLVKQFGSVQSPKPKENSYCVNCGSQISPDVTFCSNCGSKVNVEVSSQLQNNIKPATVVIDRTKNIGIAIILTVFFGPLGMLYSTITGAIVMMILSVLIAIVTLGFGLLITWPICIIWAGIAASNHNKQLISGLKQY